MGVGGGVGRGGRGKRGGEENLIEEMCVRDRGNCVSGGDGGWWGRGDRGWGILGNAFINKTYLKLIILQ